MCVVVGVLGYVNGCVVGVTGCVSACVLVC